jgi:putative membrane protein
MPAHFATALPNFLAYFAVATILLAFFLLIYLNVTPYKEIALIRGGNTAASVSLGGTLIGFALPIANVIAHSDTLLDLTLWGVVAGVVQLLAYFVVRLLLPNLAQDIPAGRVAPAAFLAALSLAVGILNAACMTY